MLEIAKEFLKEWGVDPAGLLIGVAALFFPLAVWFFRRLFPSLNSSNHLPYSAVQNVKGFVQGSVTQTNQSNNSGVINNTYQNIPDEAIKQISINIISQLEERAKSKSQYDSLEYMQSIQLISSQVFELFNAISFSAEGNEGFIQQATDSLKNGRIFEADDFLKRYLENNDKNIKNIAEANYFRGFISLIQTNYSKAEPYFLAAYSLQPNNKFYIRAMGEIKFKLGIYDVAQEFFQKFLDTLVNENADEHDVASAHNNLAMSFAKQGEYEIADSYFEKSLQLYEYDKNVDISEKATSFNNYGVFLDESGKYQKSEEYLRTAIEIREELFLNYPSEETKLDLGISYGNIAVVYEHQDRYFEAEELYLKACDLLNDIPEELSEVRHNLGVLYKKIGRIQEAVEQLFDSYGWKVQNLPDLHPSRCATASVLNEIMNEHVEP